MTTPTQTNPFGSTNVPAEYAGAVSAAAARWNINPSLLAAQLDAESGFNPKAMSPAGAEGIAQFMPGTARSMGIDPWNPAQAIDAMARLDAQYVRQFGSIDKALAAYNAGAGAVEKYGGIPPFAETKAYVAKILAKANQQAGNIGSETLTLVDNPVAGTTSLLERIISPEFWRRVGLGALGLAVVGAGAYFLAEKELKSAAGGVAGGIKVAKKIAGNVG